MLVTFVGENSLQERVSTEPKDKRPPSPNLSPQSTVPAGPTAGNPDRPAGAKVDPPHPDKHSSSAHPPPQSTLQDGHKLEDPNRPALETAGPKPKGILKPPHVGTKHAYGFKERFDLTEEHVLFGSRLRRHAAELHQDNRLADRFGHAPNIGHIYEAKELKRVEGGGSKSKNEYKSEKSVKHQDPKDQQITPSVTVKPNIRQETKVVKGKAFSTKVYTPGSKPLTSERRQEQPRKLAESGVVAVKVDGAVAVRSDAAVKGKQDVSLVYTIVLHCIVFIFYCYQIIYTVQWHSTCIKMTDNNINMNYTCCNLIKR